ncbi:MAG: hypothetical protein QNK04_30980 [Myxococcota bacterium]|nr:hypothetical protein [Myxococcota bacterium]
MQQKLPHGIAHLGLFAIVALLLVVSGRPLFTDDAWWHLALGGFYASQGPVLAEDPLLHTAVGAPAPAAWLFDVALFAVERSTGFQGLRVAHVLAVGAIVALAWSLLQRASRNAAFASAATAAFVALATYRLIQLRPHLFTIAATLLLYRLLLEDRRPPSALRVALGAALLALWANTHAAFLLGPILLGAAVAGLLLAAPLRLPGQRADDRQRAWRLGAAAAAGLLASVANPSGLTPHLAYLRAGRDSPDLARVGDEWAAFPLFQWPVLEVPPTPLAWALVWTALLLVGAGALVSARRWRSGDTQAADPALLAVALASAAAMVLALRFAWLGLFPLLVLGTAVRGLERRHALAWSSAAAASLLAVGFAAAGDWALLSRGLPLDRRYAQPYTALKFRPASVWFLHDAGVRGNLFNDYSAGGFLGYWLAPDLRAFTNGTLNVPIDVQDAYRAIREARGPAAAVGIEALLERHRVDLFLGQGPPFAPHPRRPTSYTAHHLERSPGWLLVFRNLRGAVYLRLDARNEENLRRVAAYYEARSVPFDAERGFEPARVIAESPAWAAAQGLVPADLAALRAAPPERLPARHALASLYAALGLYEQAAEIDRGILAARPHAPVARRRLVWSLLRLDRADEAVAEAERLARARALDPLSARVAAAAPRYAALPPGPERDALAATLPVFTRAEARQLFRGVAGEEIRTSRE